MKIYIDGEYYEQDEAKISVYDHGLLYGDGVFEGIRIYNGNVFRLREHLLRLYRSARAILLDIPLTVDEMARAVEKTVSENARTEGYIRLVVTRGVGNLGIDPAKCGKSSIIIIVDGIELYPEEFYRKGIAVVTASTRRLSPDGIDPRIKSLNYLNNILAKIEARQAGCQEAVMLNHEGFVAECTADNIFLVHSGILLTPAPCYGALGGITRESVIELAHKAGISVRESALTRYDLYTGDECFLTGTGAEIIPVVTIDGRSIGNGSPGEVTRRLEKRFKEYVRGNEGMKIV